ncbi:MAG TPA: YihY/virulence factor BrkB family protein [Planctomycetaceae bacterium]|nr:YihY/virulence factor BrkB family protein [Planctomycetaceae bacterium]
MGILTFLNKAGRDFLEDDCLSSGAAIAFYTVFSLPPLLTIVFASAIALGFSEQQVTHVIQRELGLPLATEEPDAKSDSEAAERQGTSSATPLGLEQLGSFSQAFGALLLLISASGVFGQLQYSLNKAWEVAPDPAQGGVWNFLSKRLLSIGLVVVLGFLLLVSLVLTAGMEQLWRWAGGTGEGSALGFVINELLAAGIATLLFAAIFQILPDAKIQWRDVWVGAAVTAVLFVIGKAVIGWYLATAHIGEDWGHSAVSVIGALVWVYYSSLIVLFGAEFTQVWSSRHQSRPEPEEGAVRAIQEQRLVPSP